MFSNFIKILLVFSLTFTFHTVVPTLAFVHGYQVTDAEAQSLKKKFKKFRKGVAKGTKKAGRGIKKAVTSKQGRAALTIVGGALIAGGIAKDSPAAAIIGVALIAAPAVLQNNVAKKYGKEMNWAGCIGCNERRIITHPDRKISEDRRRAVNAQLTEDVKDVQRALAKLGLYKKRIDGDYGKGSRAAVKEFQLSLGDEATGYLNAEQRYRLFIRAGEKGYTRTAVLNDVDNSLVKPVPASLPLAHKKAPSTVKPSLPAVPVIAEFRLAASQFDKFSKDFLQSGSQAAVVAAVLLPDGKIELDVADPVTGETFKMIGDVSAINVAPHDISDEWVRVSYQPENEDKSTVLNTRDDFDSSEQASEWIAKAKKKLTQLAKLMGKKPSIEPQKPGETKANEDGRIVIANDDAEKEKRQERAKLVERPKIAAKKPELKPVERDIAETPANVSASEDGRIVLSTDNSEAAETNPVASLEDGSKAIEAKANENGRIVIAKKDDSIAEPSPELHVKENEPVPAKAIEVEEQTKPETGTVQTIEEPKKGTQTVTAKVVTEETEGNTLEGFNLNADPGVCRQNVYVSFDFPESDKPLTHYNIVPPDGVIMIDNGDSTAYFTGSCVIGNYNYSYVYIEKAEKEEDWKDVRYEGGFQFAQLGEQCSVDLNTPSGSASVACF